MQPAVSGPSRDGFVRSASSSAACAAELTPLPAPGPRCPRRARRRSVADPAPITDGDITDRVRERRSHPREAASPGPRSSSRRSSTCAAGYASATEKDAGVEQLALRTAHLGGDHQAPTRTRSPSSLSDARERASGRQSYHGILRRRRRSRSPRSTRPSGCWWTRSWRRRCPTAEIEVHRQQHARRASGA
jgi:hypothetical protein